MLKKKREFGEKVIKCYDDDNSGTLAGKELKNMLIDYSKQTFEEDHVPTDEDAQFLLNLYDNGEKGDGAIDRSQVLDICNAFGEFIQQKVMVKNLMQKHDANANDKME